MTNETPRVDPPESADHASLTDHSAADDDEIDSVDVTGETDQTGDAEVDAVLADLQAMLAAEDLEPSDRAEQFASLHSRLARRLSQAQQ